MSDGRKTITVSEDAFEEAKEHKGDRTWDEIILAGAHADETDVQRDEGHDEGQPQPLTADDVPMLKREIAEELESRMNRAARR